jgi:YHS domain-containing protein
MLIQSHKSLTMSTNFKLLLISIAFLSACNTDSNKEKTPAPAATAIMPADSTKSYDQALIDNKKDPSCGMPTTAGVSDTLHFKNKVLGFCSTECKESFLKDAEKSFASVEFKK